MAENPTLNHSSSNGFGDGGGSTAVQGTNRGELTPQQLELQKEIERQQKIFEAVQPKFAEVDVVINALKQAVVKAHAELAVETADIEAKIAELKEARQQFPAILAQDPIELAERIAENETKQEYLKEELESSRIIWLFNAQVDIFLNYERGKDNVQIWALALMRQNRGQNNGQAEVPTGTDTFVDSHEHTRYLFNLPPGSDTNEELGKFFAELAPNENDEENLATINALLAGDPELFRKVSADVLVVQQKLRADIGLSGAVEQNEERHLKKVGENIHAVLPNNPLAELVGFVHDAHKFRKSLDGQRVEMNLFLHEEASAVA